MRTYFWKKGYCVEKPWTMTANHIVLAIAGIAGVARLSAWPRWMAAATKGGKVKKEDFLIE